MLERMIETLLAFNPWVEVGVKSLYWRLGFLNDALKKVLVSLRRPASAVEAALDPQALGQIMEALRQAGIGPGDLVIVHSSMGNLKKTGAKPKEIIEALRALIGPEGTLAMPTFPILDIGRKGTAYISDAPVDAILTYDVQKTPAWTGVLGLSLMKMPGAVRSRHPINSLAAVGPLAQPMMDGNIDGDDPLPCGRQSAWWFCAAHDAKIVALGTDMAHSLTMIHVAEDSYEKAWPIANWYRPRRFRIVDGDFAAELSCHERRPRWAINYAERTLAKDLRRAGVIERSAPSGISVEVCRAQALLDFLNARKATGYPYFFFGSAKRKK
ncbi:MAG: AAC(3) family N-acetyltransferase [Alphaproteobacteria bacterium]|nr:AAC(3) family N-acetyltransferase [Alphaproteobacteria bacterium]